MFANLLFYLLVAICAIAAGVVLFAFLLALDYLNPTPIGADTRALRRILLGKWLFTQLEKHHARVVSQHQQTLIAIEAEEAEYRAGKPHQPSPKSKRLTAEGRKSREFTRRFTPALAIGGVFFCTPLGPLLFGPYFIICILVIMLIVAAGTAIWNQQDWVQKSWRDEETEEREKWAKEDAEWALYEQNLKNWEQQKALQRRVEAIRPKSSYPGDAPLSPEAQRLADEIQSYWKK